MRIEAVSLFPEVAILWAEVGTIALRYTAFDITHTIMCKLQHTMHLFSYASML